MSVTFPARVVLIENASAPGGVIVDMSCLVNLSILSVFCARVLTEISPPAVLFLFVFLVEGRNVYFRAA